MMGGGVNFPNVFISKLYFKINNNFKETSAYGIIREDGYLYSTVSNKYLLVRHQDIYNYLKNKFDSVSVYPTPDFSQCFFSVQTDTIRILDEEFYLGWIISNSYDKSLAINIIPDVIRVACLNIMPAIFKNIKNLAEIRYLHLKSLKDVLKLIDEVMEKRRKEVLELINMIEIAKQNYIFIPEVIEELKKFMKKNKNPIVNTAIRNVIEKLKKIYEEEKAKEIQLFEIFNEVNTVANNIFKTSSKKRSKAFEAIQKTSLLLNHLVSAFH